MDPLLMPKQQVLLRRRVARRFLKAALFVDRRHLFHHPLFWKMEKKMKQY